MKISAESTVINDKKIQEDIEAVSQYFWLKTEGTDAGAHITEIPQAEFEDDPSGGNLLARSDGIAVRDGLTELASFGAEETIINASDGSRVVISPNSLDLQDDYHASLFSAKAEGDKTVVKLDNYGAGEPLTITPHYLKFYSGQQVDAIGGSIILSSGSIGGNSSELTLSAAGNLDISGGNSSIGITIDGQPYLVATEHTLTTSLTVNSGAGSNSQYTATKSGYYPLGVVGWRTANGSGSGGSYALSFGARVASASVGSAQITIGIRAVGGNVNNCTLYATILWQKRTAAQ